MASTKEMEGTITLNLETLLTPLSILVSAIMISASIFYTFNGGGGISFNSKSKNVASSGGSIENLVKDIGVDTKKFNKCLDNNDYKKEIEKDIADGQEVGISGTPGFIIGNLDDKGNVKGVIIAGAYPFSEFEDKIETYLKGNKPEGEGMEEVTVSIDDDPIQGDKKKAKVALVEFSDYECPFCQKFHKETLDEITQKYVDTGKIIHVYRDFPLSFHEPKASEAAVAANCVKEVAGDDKYFEFGKLYYEHTKSNGEGL